MIILIGLPGSGKSTVGRQLARKLSAHFLDSDHLIEQRLGCSIREYFEREGEEAFRDVEQAVLLDVMQGGDELVATGVQIVLEGSNSQANQAFQTTQAAQAAQATQATQATQSPRTVQAQQSQQTVLSTGGGSVLREANRQLLKGCGQVVYLRATPEDLYRRLRHDRHRPLLQAVDPLQRLRDLYAQRDPLYRATAHIEIETGRPSVATLVSVIMAQLGLLGAEVAALAPASS